VELGIEATIAITSLIYVCYSGIVDTVVAIISGEWQNTHDDLYPNVMSSTRLQVYK